MDIKILSIVLLLVFAGEFSFFFLMGFMLGREQRKIGIMLANVAAGGSI